MNENLLLKWKRHLIEGAATAATKLEEAVRIGKVRLDLMAEEARLDAKMAKLGEHCFQAMGNASLDALKEDAATAELLHAIAENQKRIADLQAKLSSAQNTQKSCCDQ